MSSTIDVDWDEGATEGGSSGSGLFDYNGRLRGILTGGLDLWLFECRIWIAEDSYYGRFDTFFPLARRWLYDDDHSDWMDYATQITSSKTGYITSQYTTYRGTRVSQAYDVDYFHFDVPGTGTVDVFTTGSTDTKGVLYNTRRMSLRSNDDGGNGRNFRIRHSVTPGKHYVRVNGYGDTTGSYTLRVRFTPSDHHGDTPGTATSVEPDSSIPGNIEEASDTDVFRIVVPQTGILTVWTTGDTDTYGTLTRQGGEEPVATDDDGSGQDYNFQIVETLTAGTYFVAVDGYNNDTGPYTLHVSFEASDRSPVRGFLENPQPGSFQSGIGVLSGWVCEATGIELEFHHGVTGTVFRAAAGYGTGRADTEGQCNDIDNGFGLLFNWNLLGDGLHTVRALADGVEFARSTFTVTTLGLGAYPTGLSGECSVPDFPTTGQTTVVEWQEAQQNFVIVEVR